MHGFENRGTDDATYLAMATPGVFGPDYFREIAEVLAASAGGPPDRAALGEVMHRHGLTPSQPTPLGSQAWQLRQERRQAMALNFELIAA